jgi:hypothetical protein
LADAETSLCMIIAIIITIIYFIIDMTIIVIIYG